MRMHSQEVAGSRFEPGTERLKIITQSIYGAPLVAGEVGMERRGSLSWVLESPEHWLPCGHESSGAPAG